MRRLWQRLGWAALAGRIWPGRLLALRFGEDGPGEGADPFASVLEPRHGGRGPLRSGAVALEEPREDVLIDAISRER